MLYMIFTLMLEVLAKTWFYAINSYDWHSYDFQTKKKWSDYNPGLMTLSSFLPVTLLSMGITINVRNWLYYYIKIQEMVIFTTLDPSDSKYGENLKKMNDESKYK